MWGWTNNRKAVSKCMKSWRAWQYPLESARSRILIFRPRIVCAFWSVRESQVYNVEKINKTHRTQIRSIRTYYIPAKKSIRIIKVTTGHPCQPQKVLRKECQIYPNKKQEELRLSMMFRVLTTSKFANPEIKGSKNTRHCSYTQNIMKMCYYIISQNCSKFLLLPGGLDSLLPRYLN